MRVQIIIPARLGSTRLPGKALAMIGGLPMVVHVARAAARAGFGPALIAAGHAKIVQAARAHGIEAVLTDPHLPSGSDRVLAAATLADPDKRNAIIVNVQGDMPTLTPDHVQAAVAALEADVAADIATLVFASRDTRDAKNPGVVKAILEAGADGPPCRAQDFTRAAAPTPFWHHIGIYVFRRPALERFCALPPSARECRDRLEQLRALDAGMKITCAIVQQDCPGIDTAADLARIRARFAGDDTS